MKAMSSSVTLLPHDARLRIVRDLEKIQHLGSSLSALGKVQHVVQLITERAPCKECDDLYAELCSSFTLGGVSLAIEELGIYIVDIATRVEDAIYETTVLTGGALREVEEAVASRGKISE